MAAGYPNLESDLLAQPNVYVVLCARAYLWLRKATSFDRSTNLTIPRITPDEANRLASRIVEFNAADQLASVEALSAAINSSITGEHPHLLAAMMTATRGTGFISIIDGMIRNFEDAEEDWALRTVACGALLDDLAGNELGRLPHRVLLQLIVDRLEGLVPAHALRDRANQKLRSFGSEIVPLRITDRRNATEYDLRHPDITLRVLSHFYGLRWDETVEQAETLADDLCRIANAELKAEMPGRRSETLRAAPYSEAAGKALVSLDPGRYAWLPRLLGREFIRYLLEQYGNYEREIGRRADLLWQWAAAESLLEQPETGKGRPAPPE